MLRYQECSKCALRLRKLDTSGKYCTKYNKRPEEFLTCWVMEQDEVKEKHLLGLTDAEVHTIREVKKVIHGISVYAPLFAFTNADYDLGQRCKTLDKALAEILSIRHE